MHKKEQQWEGFEEFCDSSSLVEKQQQVEKDKSASEDRLMTAEPSKELKIQNDSNKPKTSPFKKVKPKLKIDDGKIKQEKALKKEERNTVTLDIQSPKKPIKNQTRFERIPIMRKEDDYRFAGNVVYRSFAPRSSETYFRTFKDIDFEAQPSKAKFKNGENFIFNSRFESGNLSMAFQGG